MISHQLLCLSGHILLSHLSFDTLRLKERATVSGIPYN